MVVVPGKLRHIDHPLAGGQTAPQQGQRQQREFLRFQTANLLTSIFFSVVLLFLTLALEPLWLHFWGWTPGKWVFEELISLQLRLLDEQGLIQGERPGLHPPDGVDVQLELPQQLDLLQRPGILLRVVPPCCAPTCWT